MKNAVSHLSITTALVLFLAGSATAQTSTAPPPGTGLPPQTATSPNATARPDVGQPSSDSKGSLDTTHSKGSLDTTLSMTDARSKEAPVVGLEVRTIDDKKIGKIDDVVVSPDGKVDKLVVAVGGLLGVGSKPVAVNWHDVQIDGNNRIAIVAMSDAELRNAPVI